MARTTPVQSKPKRPSHHTNNSKSSFKNPWPSADAPTWNELLQLSFPFSLYSGKLHHQHGRSVKVVAPDWGESSLKALTTQKSDVVKEDCVIGTWLGHAGALVEFPSLVSEEVEERGKSTYFLFDPIFSSKAGPNQYIGPGRLKESPCRIADLPGCDAVLISHNHYDHLDFATMTDILKTFPETVWFVPLGNRKWFLASGVRSEKCVELDWWEEWESVFADNGVWKYKDCLTNFKVSCVPAQHTTGRSGLDKDSTLWCGWIIERFIKPKTSIPNSSASHERVRKGVVYHAGDTGYRRTTKSDVVCPVFKDIGKKFGPFDLSFIPIWRGGTLGFISYVGLRLSHNDIPSALHCSPADAIAIHKDVKSRNTVGIHFGTFIGSENESHDALIEFYDASSENEIKSLDDVESGESGRAGTLNIGGSLAVEIE